MPDKIEIKVRGYHLDGFQHVNNARYLEFLEEARWAFFEDCMDLESTERNGYEFTVVNISINYRQAARLNDLLIVETSLREIGSRSAKLHQIITKKEDGSSIADADITFVMRDKRLNKSAVLEGELLKGLEAASCRKSKME